MLTEGVKTAAVLEQEKKVQSSEATLRLSVVEVPDPSVVHAPASVAIEVRGTPLDSLGQGVEVQLRALMEVVDDPGEARRLLRDAAVLLMCNNYRQRTDTLLAHLEAMRGRQGFCIADLAAMLSDSALLVAEGGGQSSERWESRTPLAPLGSAAITSPHA